MWRFILYPLFGLAVIGAYAASAMTGTDITTVKTQRRTLPKDANIRGGVPYGVAPIIWYTGFHGPQAYRPRYNGSSGSYRRSGGSYGGFGGGK